MAKYMLTLYKLPEYYLSIINALVDTKLEVNTLDNIFKKNKANSVLDVACGVGRHSIHLAKLGYDITGIDYSPYQLKKAKKDAKGIKIKFLLKNANNFKFQKKFDAAMCMWTTLGEEPLRYWDVIKNVYNSLKPSGIFVIDNRSWEYIPQKREEVIAQSFSQNGININLKLYDRYTDNFRIRTDVMDINGKAYKDLCITHLLKTDDWIKELKKAGFKKFEVYYDYKKKKSKKPKRVIIVAKK